ncbi:hypothetical protein Leryth_015951 [Lithospermum erythrorhizon]|nr:hypothetical protein Leryth_015951 [Lithospermum erythrorhizon]
MAAQEVNQGLLSDLVAMGFSEARATMAILSSGNSGIEEAINWIVDHENELDTDEIPSDSVDIEIESPDPSQISEQVKLKAQELRDHARRKREEEEKKLDHEREKERIRAGKELLGAKRVAEEHERKRFIDQRKAEKEEVKRARERIRQKLHQDKLERWGRLHPQKQSPISTDSGISRAPEIKIPVSQKAIPLSATSAEESMRECLRYLKIRHQDDDYRVKRAFQTLLTYVRNVIVSPGEEKFRRIRLNNPAFQERVGRFKEGIQFLELCGFEKSDNFLVLPSHKIDITRLNVATTALLAALTNPFFGLLSRDSHH